MIREKSKEGFFHDRSCNQSANLKQPESYDKYRLSKSERVKYGLAGIGLAALVAYVFYRSAILFFILLIPSLCIIYRKKQKELLERRREELNLQFREMMHAVTAGLQAGYSIENAFIHAHQDICLLYGETSMMARELSYMTRELRNNRNLEDLLSEFAVRTQVADIRDFAQVFHIAKRSGGNLPGILKNTADIISDKIEVKREITTMISAKRLEQSIMNVVPFAIILYINFTSPGFFDPLYHNFLGIVIMSVLLAVYMAALFLADRIIQTAERI